MVEATLSPPRVKRSLSDEEYLAAIRRFVDQERLAGRRRELVFVVSVNERSEVERVDYDPPRMRIA